MKKRLLAALLIVSALTCSSCDASEADEYVAFAKELWRRAQEKFSQITPELIESWINPQHEPYRFLKFVVESDPSDPTAPGMGVLYVDGTQITSSDFDNLDPRAGENTEIYQYRYTGGINNEIVIFLPLFYSEKDVIERAHVESIVKNENYDVEPPSIIIFEKIKFDVRDDGVTVTAPNGTFDIPIEEIKGGKIRKFLKPSYYDTTTVDYSFDEETGVISCDCGFYAGTREPNGSFRITYKFVKDEFVCDTIEYLQSDEN